MNQILSRAPNASDFPPDRVFVVSHLGGETTSTTIVLGCETPVEALDHFAEKQPGVDVIACVSLAQIEAIPTTLRQAIAASVAGVEPGIPVLRRD